jgi:hypothetical protein
MKNAYAKEEFFNLGLEYYIAGRYAVFSGLVSIAGNLLHHATELFLKGCLSNNLDISQLKKLSHSLANLWTCCKANNLSPELSEFDKTVNDLDQFEDLRYPPEFRKGKVICISSDEIAKSIAQPQKGTKIPIYSLSCSDIDKLVKVLFTMASINPAFFLGRLREDAKRYLFLDNLYRLD